MCPCNCVCVYYSAIKKEENVAICVKMDGFWEHYAKWGKSDREREILYDLIYVEFKKKKHEKRSDGWLSLSGGGGCGVGELNEGDQKVQKVQTFCYKIRY